MITNDTIIHTIIITYFIGLFISILAAMMYYSNYLTAIDNKEYEFGIMWGAWNMKYDFTFFINVEAEDEFTKKIIKQHRKAVIVFWTWFLMLVPIVIICNLID
ncbi:MAG: hypothetical protein RJA07_1814 [Bacteroidota bacterium]|jgi:hypothetical protein